MAILSFKSTCDSNCKIEWNSKLNQILMQITGFHLLSEAPQRQNLYNSYRISVRWYTPYFLSACLFTWILLQDPFYLPSRNRPNAKHFSPIFWRRLTYQAIQNSYQTLGFKAPWIRFQSYFENWNTQDEELRTGTYWLWCRVSFKRFEFGFCKKNICSWSVNFRYPRHFPLLRWFTKFFEYWKLLTPSIFFPFFPQKRRIGRPLGREVKIHTIKVIVRASIFRFFDNGKICILYQWYQFNFKLKILEDRKKPRRWEEGSLIKKKR